CAREAVVDDGYFDYW
nr:immunoglobulin heavy chain junction region [Mus musculus]MBK4195533.1 immunoglobulin heavy chain junction region [Mus musculus]